MIDDAEFPVEVQLTLKVRGGLDFSSSSWDTPEYHIVLYIGETKSTPTFTYYLSKFKGKTRELTRFESLQLLKKIRALKLKLPIETNEIVLADPPPPWYQLIIKYRDSVLDMTWDGDDFYGDEEAPDPASDLVRLIEDLEPLDYEGLGVDPPKYW